MKVTESQIPKCNMDTYAMGMLNHENVGKETYFIARVFNTEDEDINIGIEVDTKYIKKVNGRHMLLYIDDNYKNGSEVVLEYDFYRELRNNEFLVALLWHEIGHFHTLPLLNNYIDDRQSIMNKRREAIESGVIPIEEMCADLFSVCYVGKETVIKALNWCISKRRKMEDDTYRFLAIRELNSRKRYIKSVDEENIMETLNDIIIKEKERNNYIKN